MYEQIVEYSIINAINISFIPSSTYLLSHDDFYEAFYKFTYF